MDKTRKNLILNWFGAGLILLGWYTSTLHGGPTHAPSDGLFNKWTVLGLFYILIGVYLPKLWGKSIRLSKWNWKL